MTTQTIAPTLTVTVKESRLTPGVGYETSKTDFTVLHNEEAATALYNQTVAFWKNGQTELLEQDGTTVEFQVGAWRRVMVELH